MHRLAVMLGALVALVGCGGGSDDGSASVGPAPTSKQQAAQDVTVASTAVSEALSSAQGSSAGNPSTKSVGIHLQDTVSVNGNCAGGGSASITVSENAAAPTTGTGSETVSYSLTAHACKTTNGDVIDGGPLAITIDITSNLDSDAGVSAAEVKEHVTYSGNITVAGSVNESVSFNNLAIDVSVDASSTAGGTTESESVEFDGSVTVNGASYSYSNESFSVTAGG